MITLIQLCLTWCNILTGVLLGIELILGHYIQWKVYFIMTKFGNGDHIQCWNGKSGWCNPVQIGERWLGWGWEHGNCVVCEKGGGW